MKKGLRAKPRTQAGRPGTPQRVGFPELELNETDNVQYFLNALRQISHALHAFGYPSEADALAEVKVDLHRRLFGNSEKSIRALEVFH